MNGPKQLETQPTVREEEEDDSETENDEDAVREDNSGHPEALVEAAPDADGNHATQHAIQELLENLRRRRVPEDDSPPTPADDALNLLRDHVLLSKAQEALSQQSQDKSLDVIFRARICAMIGILNLFLDPNLPFGWRKASTIVAKAQGHGPARVRNIRKWILDFVREGTLPFHSYCHSRQTVLEDNDILQEIQEQLTEKAKDSFIKAQDVCDIITMEKIQTIFTQLGICKPTISLSTAHRWLAKLEWRYGKKLNGMYFDGHERDDVVAYQQAFVERWANYETRFQIWDDNGCPLPRRSNSELLPLVLITHDESIFFQNDERKTCWGHQDSAPAPKPKGEGQSLMVSDFLTAEWGRLCNSNRCV